MRINFAEFASTCGLHFNSADPSGTAIQSYWDTGAAYLIEALKEIRPKRDSVERNLRKVRSVAVVNVITELAASARLGIYWIKRKLIIYVRMHQYKIAHHFCYDDGNRNVVYQKSISM